MHRVPQHAKVLHEKRRETKTSPLTQISKIQLQGEHSYTTRSNCMVRTYHYQDVFITEKRSNSDTITLVDNAQDFFKVVNGDLNRLNSSRKNSKVYTI